MQLNKALYKKFYNLARQKTWITKPRHEDAFFALVDNCSSEQDIELLFRLFERFHYLTQEDVTAHLSGMMDSAFQQWLFPPSATQIVASHPSTDPDSSQFIMQMLKPVLRRKELTVGKVFNKLFDAVNYCGTFPHILIVDEFVGTGRTMFKRVNDLKSRIKQKVSDSKKPVDIKIGVVTIAAMKAGADFLRDNEILFSCQLELSRGISDQFVEPMLTDFSNSMRRLESELAPEIDGHKLPSFGRGKAEALYAIEESNIPNSVFPIYWWCKDKHMRVRKTHFDRLEP
jgi:hypothetical protein